jgi:hypothetical protein
MQRLQLIMPSRWMRALLFVASGKGPEIRSIEPSKTNRIDAEAICEHLKQDLGLTDTHDRHHQTRRPPSAFDAARDVFLRRPL